MPPKAKYDKEQIIDIAFNIVRENGADILTARNLAQAMGTSTAPIFNVFDTIAEIKQAVIDKGKALYADYVRDGLNEPIPFKGVGLKYIQFSKEEPELFKLLFMTGDGNEHITNYLPAFDENSVLVLDKLVQSYNIDNEKAKKLYNHMAVYSYGFASLFAQKINIFTMEDIDQMLSELFLALTE